MNLAVIAAVAAMVAAALLLMWRNQQNIVDHQEKRGRLLQMAEEAARSGSESAVSLHEESPAVTAAGIMNQEELSPEAAAIVARVKDRGALLQDASKGWLVCAHRALNGRVVCVFDH